MTLGTYCADEPERLELTRSLSAFRRSMLTCGGSLLLYGLAMVVLAISDGDPWRALHTSIFSAMGLFVMRRAPKPGPITSLQRQYTVLPDAIRVTTLLNGVRYEETRTPWDQVLYVKSDARGIRLVLRKGGSFTIPDVVFETDEQRQSVLTLSRAHPHIAS